MWTQLQEVFYLPPSFQLNGCLQLCLIEILEMTLFIVNLIFTPTRKLKEVLKKNAFKLSVVN